MLKNQIIPTSIPQVTSYDYESSYGTADYTITTFPSSDSGVNGITDVIVAVDATVSSTDDGILFEMGGGGGAGFAAAVNNNTLRVRAFDSSGDSAFSVGAGQAHLEIDISSYTGSAATYYFVVDISTYTLSAYIQVGGANSTNQITSLGSDTADGTTTNVYGTADKTYGDVSATLCDMGAAYETAFTGTLSEIRIWTEDATLDVSGFGTSNASIAGGPIGFATPIQYVGVASATNTFSLSFSAITDLQEGDLVIVWCVNRRSPITLNSTGWTTVVNTTNDRIVNFIAYKVMGSTVDTSIEFLADTGFYSSYVDENKHAIALRNAEYDYTGGYLYNNFDSKAINPPLVTTSEAGCAVVTLTGVSALADQQGRTAFDVAEYTKYGESGAETLLKLNVPTPDYDAPNITYFEQSYMETMTRSVIVKPKYTISTVPRTIVGFKQQLTVLPLSYVGATSASGTNTLSLSGITNLTEGDLVLFMATDDAGSPTINSVGWTVLHDARPNSIGNVVAYKIMGSTVDTEVEISSTFDALSAIAFRNAEYVKNGGTEETSAESQFNPADITIDDDNSAVILCAMIDDDNSTISTVSTGYTLATETGRRGASHAFMYKTGISAGTEDPSSYTWATTDNLLNLSVVLKGASLPIRYAAGFKA